MSNLKILYFNRKSILSYLGLLVVVIIPAVFALFTAINAGSVSVHDYWGIISNFYTENGFSGKLSDWFVNQNGHILFIPTVIYALNIIFTQGSNIGLTLIAWIFALLQTLILIHLLPENIKDWRINLILVFVLSAFSFTPSAATDNWTAGFSGVHWIGANLFAVTAIASLFHYFQTTRLRWFLASITFTMLATLTYGTSLALWVALGMGTLLIMHRLWLGLVYIGCTFITYICYFNYVNFSITASNGISFTFEGICTLYVYTTTYLGSIFTENFYVASFLGSIGLLFFIIMFGNLLLRSAPKICLVLFPWSTIHLYTVGNAILTGITRSHLGIEQAITPRYASIPALFWASSIVISMYYVYQVVPQWSWRRYFPILAVITLFILAMYPIGIRGAKRVAHMRALQPLAFLSVTVGVPDDVAIYHAITIVPGQFVTMIPILKQHGHIPFDKNDTSCGQLNETIPAHSIQQIPQDDVNGFFDFMDRYSEDGFRVVGWTHSDNQIQCIVLLNEENKIRGFAIPGFYRQDVSEILDLSNLYTGWLGYVRVPSPQEQLQAYVLLEGNEKWTPLHDSHSPQNPGTINSDIYTGYYYQ